MSEPAARSRRRSLVFVSYLVLLIVAALATAVGASMFFVVLVAAVPVLVTLRTRMSLPATLALLLVSGVWVVLLLFVIARYTGVPALALMLAAAVGAAILCAVHLFRRGFTFSLRDAADLGFVGAGGVVWCVVILAAALLPAGSPLSWSMTGDAANNILFARRLIDVGGVSVGAGENPVPLTAALIALFMLPTAGADQSVANEIVALAQMWSFGIVAACVMSGALALSLITKRTGMALLAVALTSLVPLSWILLAGPLLLGFVNFHLTLALICASLIALVHARRTPASSFITITLSLAAVLALWAPLAGIPGVALVVLVFSQWRQLIQLRGLRLGLVVVAALQPLALFAVLSLPSLLAHSELLQDAKGAVFEFAKVLPAALVVLLVACGVMHMRATRSLDVGRILIAVLGGGGLCLAALLWMRRNEASLWSYYQSKYLWFLMAIVMIVAVAVGLCLAATISRHAARSAMAAVAVVLVTVGVSEYARATVPTFSNDPAAMRSPLVSIVTGDFFSVGTGDRVFHRVDELTRADESTMLWRSGDPDEDWILFWIIQMSAGDVDDIELRAYAYYHDIQSIDDLCTIRELMGAPVTVITADPELVLQAQQACPDLGPVVLQP